MKQHRCPLHTCSVQIHDTVQLGTCTQLGCVFDHVQSGQIVSTAGLQSARDFFFSLSLSLSLSTKVTRNARLNSLNQIAGLA